MRSASRRRGGAGLAVFAAYAIVAFLYFGLRLIVEPGGHYFGYGSDPKAFIWCFGWWPTAILHGENPFVSHALWAPGRRQPAVDDVGSGARAAVRAAHAAERAARLLRRLLRAAPRRRGMDVPTSSAAT